jgi:thioredoxin 1
MAAGMTTDANFDQDVLKNDKLVLVDFWAEWCGPCRMIAPMMDELADEDVGKVAVYKLNVDENPSIPSQYRVQSIPLVLFFKDGEVVDQVVGARPKDQYQQAIARHTAP